MGKFRWGFCRGLFYVMAVAVSQGAGAQSPGLGQPVHAERLHNITVFQDGRGLPPGRGSVKQGRQLYTQHCLACHGQDGQGGINDALAGGRPGEQRTIGNYWPYAPTLFDYIRRAMPYQSPGQLTATETYSVVAYLLYLNDLWPEQQELDAAGLTAVVMPNRKNFVSDYELP